MQIRLAHLNKTFQANGQSFTVDFEVFATSSRSCLSSEGKILATDALKQDDPDYMRNHHLAFTRPDGSILEVEVGPANIWGYGANARLDGQIIFETHKGRTLGYGPKMKSFMEGISEGLNEGTEEERQKAAAMKAKTDAAWKRNWPSLATDISLGLFFFLVAREFGLVTAAVGGAAAGLILWVVQKLTRIDLLGGLAVFGIVMSLLSAGFALMVQDERIIQHRGTILGILGALPFLLDGLFAKGQKLARRLARYFAFDVDAARLGIGMGLISLAAAGMNAIAVALLTRDAWLVYTTFLDMPVVILLFLGCLMWARKGPEARTY